MMALNGIVLKGIVTNKKMMGRLYLIMILFQFSLCVNAQVKIGNIDVGNEVVVVDQPGKILGFVDDCSNTKGIILSIVGELPAEDDEVARNENVPITSEVNGTFILDGVDGMMKVFENNSWISLSYLPNNLAKTPYKESHTEIGEGVVISDNSESNSVEGVLVLESSDKALVLPKVNKPYDTVENPFPGMMCYDIDSKSLMVFDGRYWNIWKEK